MNIKKLLSALLFVVAFAFVAAPLHANYDGWYGGTSMGSCPYLGGERIASYASGKHQIAGGPLLYGSDSVYRLADKVYVQCYCSLSSSDYGIQSNWIHESYLNNDQKHSLSQNGWMRIENGSAWSLASGTYYVRNTQYQCDRNVKHVSYTSTRDECKDDRYDEKKKQVQSSYDQDKHDYDYKKSMNEDKENKFKLMKAKMYDRY